AAAAAAPSSGRPGAVYRALPLSRAAPRGAARPPADAPARPRPGALGHAPARGAGTRARALAAALGGALRARRDASYGRRDRAGKRRDGAMSQLVSTKITAAHLGRVAYVYVRQSTVTQVHEHLESQRRQYALTDQARACGWRQVEVIDEDLGRSGSGRVARPGFERLVAAVCNEQVGGVFALEASRLARNSRDWHHLVDLCGLTATLLIDGEGVYDPRDFNDRLLLGLKGTMSEWELGVMRQRSLEALRLKAARGELYTTVPIGFLRTRDNRLELDPDQRIQEAIRLVFRQFTATGSVRQTLLWFRSEGVELPAVEYGPFGRSVVW